MNLKKRLLSIIILLLTCLRSHAQCLPNVDFETGGYSNWNFYNGLAICSGGCSSPTYLWPGSPGAPATAPCGLYAFGGNPHHESITNSSAPFDNFGLFPLVAPASGTCDPGGGMHALKLGSTCGGDNIHHIGYCEKAEYVFTVPSGASNYTLLYRYAVVLNAPGTGPGSPPHSPGEMARVTIKARDITTGMPLSCPDFTYVAPETGGSIPGFMLSSTSVPGGPVWYKNWSLGSINLSGYAGHNIALEFVSSSCTVGGHFGYAYVDVSCGSWSTVLSPAPCYPGPVSLPSAPCGFMNYTWYVAGAWGSPIGTGQTLSSFPSPATPTTYAVVMVPHPGFGCAETLYVAVSPISKPTANISGTYTLCSEEPGCIPVTGTSGATVYYSLSTGASGSIVLPGCIPIPATTTATGTSFTVSLTGVSIPGCSGTATGTVSVTINPLPPAPTITETTGHHCEGDILTFHVHGIPGFIIAYSTFGPFPVMTTATLDGSGDFFISTTAVPPSVTFYVYSIVDPATGCELVVDFSLPICIDPHPALGPLWGPNPICEGTTHPYHIGGTGWGSGIGSWSCIPAGIVSFSSSGGSPVNITANWPGTANITFSLTNCCASVISSTTITINPMPAMPTFTYTGCSVPCPGSLLTFNVSGSPGSTISWEWLDPSFVAHPQPPLFLPFPTGIATVTIPTGPPGTYYINIMSAAFPAPYECPNTLGFMQYIDVDWPKADFGQIRGPICEGDCFHLEFYGPPGGEVYFTELPGTGISTTVILDGTGYGISALLCPSVTTTYQITGVRGCCTHMSPGPTATITVLPYPVVTLTYAPIPLCEGTPLVLTAISTPPSPFYDWYIPGIPPFSSGSTYTVTSYATLATAGIYSVTAWNGPCPTTATVDVKVTPAPWATFLGDGVYCPGSGPTVNLTIKGLAGTTVYYSISTGGTGSVTLPGVFLSTVVHTFPVPAPTVTTVYTITGMTHPSGCLPLTSPLFATSTITIPTMPPCPAHYNPATGMIDLTGWGPGMSMTFYYTVFIPGSPIVFGYITYTGASASIPLSFFPSGTICMHMTNFNDGICDWTYPLDTCYIYIPAPKSGSEPDELPTGNNMLAIVPNPNKGSFTLSGYMPGMKERGMVTIEIMDVLGRIISTDVTAVTDGRIEKKITMESEVANGVYLLKVRNDVSNQVIRFTLDR